MTTTKSEAPAEFFADYLTEADVARLRRCSVQSIRLMNRKRIGPPRIKIGRTILYRREAVEAWLRKHETQPIEFTRRKK